MHYNRTFARVIMAFFNVKTFRSLLPGLLAACGYTALLVYGNEYYHGHIHIQPFIYQLVGIVLGLMLVFRTNTAYERWWEGRRLWGNLLTAARNISHKLNAYLPDEAVAERRSVAYLLANYAIALKEHLRSGVKFEELIETTPPHIDEWRRKQFVPTAIMASLNATVYSFHRKGLLQDVHLLTLNPSLDMFAEVANGCERIKRTPIPYAYRVHLLKFIFLFIAMLPFGFVSDLGYWAISVVALIYYAFVGLDYIAGEIEDPFGTDANDLPTDTICETLRRSVNEILVHERA